MTLCPHTTPCRCTSIQPCTPKLCSRAFGSLFWCTHNGLGQLSPQRRTPPPFPAEVPSFQCVPACPIGVTVTYRRQLRSLSMSDCAKNDRGCKLQKFGFCLSASRNNLIFVCCSLVGEGCSDGRWARRTCKKNQGPESVGSVQKQKSRFAVTGRCESSIHQAPSPHSPQKMCI